MDGIIDFQNAGNAIYVQDNPLIELNTGEGNSWVELKYSGVTKFSTTSAGISIPVLGASVEGTYGIDISGWNGQVGLSAEYDDNGSIVYGTVQYSGSTKLSATNTGVDVTGVISSDTLSVGGSVFGSATDFTVESAANFQGNVRMYSGLLDGSGASGSSGQVLSSTGTGIDWIDLPTGSSVNISTTAPGSPSSGDMWWDSDVGNLFIYYNDGTSSQWVEASPNPKSFDYNASTGTYTLTGNLTVTGDINSNSDEKLKENINTFDGGLAAVNALRGVRYNWKESGKPSIGLIAQEVEKILPELVSEDNDIKSVQYGNIVAVLIEAVKELSARVEELENK
jgi:hypothetical protein